MSSGPMPTGSAPRPAQILVSQRWDRNLSRWVGVSVGIITVTTERSGPIFWGVTADIPQLSIAQS